MKILGSLLILLGIAAIVVNQMQIDFVGTAWIENWGADIGWAIRGGVIVLGVLLWIVSSLGGSKSAA